MSERSKKRLTPTQLLSFIRKTDSFDHVTAALRANGEEPVFCHSLYQSMEKHRLTAKDMIAESGIERSYFYHILSGQKTPSRDIVLRLALCLRATLTETNLLLCLAQRGALYPMIRRDAAIIFAIEKKYTMQQTNEFLIKEREQPLYQEELS